MLRAVSRIAPPGIEVEVYGRLAEIPLFNPDLEVPEPLPITHLRQRINAADALLIASPEYAHGVSGVLKNALDWMVGNESFVHKPVALLNASPRARHAQRALREILRTMSAHLVETASIEVPLLGAGLGEDEIVQHPQIKPALQAALLALTADVASIV